MPHLDKWEMEYVYQDGDGYVFMDLETCDQITLSRESAGDRALYLKEGMRAQVVFRDGRPLSLEPPITVELAVADIELGMTSAATSGRHQCAVLETGLKLMVPAFIRVGETIVVDTRHGEYIGRATQERRGVRTS